MRVFRYNKYNISGVNVTTDLSMTSSVVLQCENCPQTPLGGITVTRIATLVFCGEKDSKYVTSEKSGYFSKLWEYL